MLHKNLSSYSSKCLKNSRTILKIRKSLPSLANFSSKNFIIQIRKILRPFNLDFSIIRQYEKFRIDNFEFLLSKYCHKKHLLKYQTGTIVVLEHKRLIKLCKFILTIVKYYAFKMHFR